MSEIYKKTTLNFKAFLPIPDLPLEKQKELTLLALCIWAEARGEPYEGKVSVGCVVMNRWRNQSWYGKTIAKVITYPHQFTAFNPKDPNFDKMLRMKNTHSWRKCLEAAWKVYKGIHLPKGGKRIYTNATHYCRYDWNPSWRKKYKFLGQIGNHVFYEGR